MPDCVIKPPAETVRTPLAAIVDAPKMMPLVSAISAFAADIIETVPKLLFGLAFKTMGLALPAVRVVVPGIVQALVSVMPAASASTNVKFCAVTVRSPS